MKSGHTRERAVTNYFLITSFLCLLSFEVRHKLNIRSSPGLRGATIAPPLNKGTMVEILREEGDWLKVNVKMQGWVKKDYIKTG